MTQPKPPSPPRRILLPLLAVVFCAFLWPAVVTFDPGDWPSPNQYPHNLPMANACGRVGAWLSYYLHYYLGDGIYPLLLFSSLAALMKLVRGEIGHTWERTIGLILFVPCTSAAVHLIGGSSTVALPVGNGGVIGYALGELLRQNVSNLGTLIILASCLFVGLLFVTEGWVLKLPWAIKRVGQASGEAVSVARGLAASVPRPRIVLAGAGVDRQTDPEDGSRGRPGRRGKASKQAMLFDDTLEEGEQAECDEPDDLAEAGEAEELEEAEDEHAVIVAEDTREASKAKSSPSAEEIAARFKKLVPKVNFPSPERTARAEPYPKKIENWTLPDVSLLYEPEYGFTAQQEVVVREQARTLERTLEEFRLDAHVVEIDTGPVITMFELKLGRGVKVSQIASLANDIARSLKAHAVRVVAPIPGKNTVGIEVPNLQKELVRMKELMTLAGKRASNMRLPLFLGKDAGGAPLVTDLTKMPHLLIAGTTGSGKSVCINSIVVSLLMTKRPDHVKLILVDPKMVEMSQFKEVPHLMCPIVTDPAKAEKILEWAATKMEERYELLAEATVKNITEYNNLGPEGLYERLRPANEEERAAIATHVPYIVIIIDELADLMMTAAKEVEHHLSRLAQKSRAVGIHIIVATQRPEVKVVTGLVKSNLPSRICFRVSSRMDSRIVLDQNGGEVLMGQGDMLFLPPGQHKLIRAQGTYVDEAEIQAVLDDLCSRAKPEFHPELQKIKSPDQDTVGMLRDPLFERAVRVVLESKRGSVSLLQRRLTIGYSRASRLIEQMAEAGIVGEYKGSQAREVNMTVEEWDALQKQVQADMQAGYQADQEEEYAAEDMPDVDDDGVPALTDDHEIRD
ncbi:MAG: DNA translocase FtsK [Phycisphaerales bacterium]|nr:MAG: DNA translocase FtsK [Phycisphaerales bacterium]